MNKTLGNLLHELRGGKGLTLREVEKKTGVSNAYLSQLETGKADQPSPRVLHKLAEFYEFPYTELMIVAGYLQPKKDSGTGSATGLDALLMSENLNEEEVKIVKQIVAAFRQRKAGLAGGDEK